MRKVWNKFYVLMALVMLIWSGTAAIVTYLFQDGQGLRPGEVVVCDGLICLAIMLGATLAVPASRRSLARYTLRQAPALAVCGFTGVFLYNTLLYSALHSDAKDVVPYVIINYLWPIATMVFGVLILKERLSWHVVLGGLVGFLGFLVVQLARVREVGLLADAKALGCLMALGAALAWGLFSTLARKWSDKYGLDPLSSMMLFVAAGTVFSVILFAPTARFGYIFGRWDILLALVVLGGAAHGLTNILWLRAIKLAGAGRTAVVSYLTPVLSLAYLGLFHRQWPSKWYSVLGLALILAAVLLVELRRLRQEQRAAEPLPPDRG